MWNDCGLLSGERWILISLRAEDVENVCASGSLPRLEHILWSKATIWYFFVVENPQMMPML